MLNSAKRYYDLFLLTFCFFAGKLAPKIPLMIKQLTLYSTSHCHLCELAYALILPIADNFKLTVIDIADDEVLLKQYGLRIPVLHRDAAKSELNWPFSRADIIDFLK